MKRLEFSKFLVIMLLEFLTSVSQKYKDLVDIILNEASYDDLLDIVYRMDYFIKPIMEEPGLLGFNIFFDSEHLLVKDEDFSKLFLKLRGEEFVDKNCERINDLFGEKVYLDPIKISENYYTYNTEENRFEPNYEYVKGFMDAITRECGFKIILDFYKWTSWVYMEKLETLDDAMNTLSDIHSEDRFNENYCILSGLLMTEARYILKKVVIRKDNNEAFPIVKVYQFDSEDPMDEVEISLLLSKMRYVYENIFNPDMGDHIKDFICSIHPSLKSFKNTPDEEKLIEHWLRIIS